MNAVFADINKRRDNKNVVDDKKVKKAKKAKKPPPPAKQDKITANVSREKPAAPPAPPPKTTSVQSSNSNVTPVPSFRLPFPGMAPSKQIEDVPDEQQEPVSPNPDTNDAGNEAAPNLSRRKSKKKKKKKKKTDIDSEITIDIADDGLQSPDYSKLADEELDHRSRVKTQISMLADKGYPEASTLFDFQSKPPLLIFTYTFAFIASIDIMINIPTLYNACNAAEGPDTYYYVYILAVYVAAQFLSTIFLGAWLDRRPVIEILAFLNLCIIVGNILYTFGVHNKSGVEMLIGRGVCGVGSCILVIGYAHVTRYSKLASRESRILYLRFVICLGTIIGPLIGTIVGGGTAHWRFLNIDSNNSGSFVVACIGGLYLISMIIFCIVRMRRREQRDEDRALWGRSESESQVIDEQYSDLHDDLNNYVWRPHRFCSREACMLWFLYTSAVFTFWSFTGAIIPVGAATSSTNLSTTAVYGVFVYVGITYLAAFGLNKFVFSYLKITKEKRVIVSLILMVIGSILMTSFGLNDGSGKNIYTWQIVVATPFLASGFCISTICIPALYVSLVGAGIAGLGVRMSWFFSLASFGVLAGPIYGYWVWRQFGSVNFISHTSALVLLVALLVGFVMIKQKDARVQKLVTSSQDFDIDTKEFKNDNKKSNNLNQGLLTDRL
eukprot:CAMPEP_0197043822 /NCGR_PEP_ID=MMETSP1384-20130603/20008_1 /TAXON_ID=29189 /ORGANISM="Ammonia sp." /LENGTH=665 /DNA_ID=CAMNT_0042475187 /DNA_START=13 /DNA_END=2010 /DNA_ORIENTATION=+